METLGIRLFVLAADKRNISAAGRQLGLGPAVASAKLAKLETALGADLLHRSTRKVALSSKGADFLPYAREMLAQEDAAHAALGLGKARATGTLRFAAPSTFAQLYIAPLLPRFLAAQPDVKLDLRFSDTQFDLYDGSFDLALRNSEVEDTSLRGRKLAPDRRVLCASPQYLATHSIPQTPDDLSRHQLIAFQDPSPRRLMGPDGAVAAFGKPDQHWPITVDDGLSQKVVTLAGAGVSLNSLWSVHAELRAGTLVRVLPDHEGAEPAMLWLAYPKSNVLTLKVRVFIDFLLDEIGRAPPWEPAAHPPAARGPATP